MIFLLLVLLGVDDKALDVRYTKTAPQIDGYMEDIWLFADSAYGFIQYRPKEGEPATEPMVVYVLADDDNIYFAFRCLTPGRKSTTTFFGAEDHVFLYIDTFHNKTQAYWFSVWVSGRHYDGMMLENGKIFDGSWDGVWYYGIKCFDEKIECEVKIPSKSIRYGENLPEWGVNFMFWSVKDYEVSYWNPVTQKDGNQVSIFGVLKGMNLKTKGYYIELFPEAYFRYDRIGNEETYKPSAGFNLKWDMTPQASVNATIYPDFAHIESDPYSVNLSRYPIRFSERRPFFIEGYDVFRMSSLGKDFFSPLEIFYSRRIGRSLADGGTVPILGGLKILNKEKKWNLGMIGALTEETDEGPRQGFGIVSTKYSILENSDIGIVLSSAATGRNDYNAAIGLDGVYRDGSSQFILQSALSGRNDKRGWAVSTGGMYNMRNFRIMSSFLTVSDSFDIWDVGYIPWPGLTRFHLTTGPQWFFKSGMITGFFAGSGITLIREPDSDNWSRILNFTIESGFKPMWGLNISCDIGDKHEADTSYLYYEIGSSVSSGLRTKYLIQFGSDYAHRYNYRQYWLAKQSHSWLAFEYYGLPSLSMNSTIDFVIECDPAGSISAITPYFTPRINYNFTADLTISFYSEFVMRTQEADLKNTDLYSNRFGFLYSWNFKPKSWIYIVLNDYRKRDELNRLVPQYRIGAIKVKYLIYF